MIPYFPQPVFHLGRFEIHAFGMLAALAVLVGGRTIMIRAHCRGIPVEQMFRFCFWVYVVAMLGAILSKTVLSDFPGFLADPPRAFRLSLGVRSVGGIIGGFIAGLVWCLYHRLSLFETMRRLDLVAYAMPMAWMIGRLGCALAHDHRGLPSTSWIAVSFPEGPRYDLGLIEFLFLIALTITFHLLDRRARPVGFFFGLYGVLYGGFRIWLDTLHIQPMRFYGGIAGVIIGFLGLIAMRAFKRSSGFESATSTPLKLTSWESCSKIFLAKSGLLGQDDGCFDARQDQAGFRNATRDESKGGRQHSGPHDQGDRD